MSSAPVCTKKLARAVPATPRRRISGCAQWWPARTATPSASSAADRSWGWTPGKLNEKTPARISGVPGPVELEVLDLAETGERLLDIRAGVFSFNFPGVHPHDLSAALDAEGVAVRAGHHCAQPLMRRLGVAGTARASFFVHTGADDIAALADALQRAREILGAGRLRPSPS